MSRRHAPGRRSSGPRNPRPGQCHPVTFTAYDWQGLSTAHGPMGVEIRAEGGIRGERAEVRIEHTSHHRPVAWGRIETLIEPSPHRTRPLDSEAHRCGGCNWAHMDYEAQIEAKADRLRTALGALARGQDLDIDRVRVTPSPAAEGYRNRAKYVIARRRGRTILGAYRPRSHDVERTVGCPAVHPDVNRAGRVLEEVIDSVGWPLYDPKTGRGLLRYASVRANHRREVLVTVVAASPGDANWKDLAHRLRERCEGVVGLTLDINADPGNVLFSGDHRTVWGRSEIDERYGPATVWLSGHGFGQANRDQAARLYRYAAEAAVAPLPSTGAPPVAFLDLCCGAGALGLTVAHHAGPRGFRLTGVERDEAAVRLAARAAVAADLAEQCRFEPGDAAAALAHPGSGHAESAFQVVLLNPPRTGLRPGLRDALKRALVPRLVYVSCSPETLARDLGDLLGSGYRLFRIAAFDMLPMTPHLELVAILEPGPA